MELTDIFGNPPILDHKKGDTETSQEFLEDFYAWLEKSEEQERAPGLHASELWKTCPRIPILTAKSPPVIVPSTAGERLTYDLGNAMHWWVQNRQFGPWGRLWGDWFCIACQKIIRQGVMPRCCPLCHRNWRDVLLFKETFVVAPDLRYCGHCDGIIIDRTSTRKRVLEFKSISPAQYTELREPKVAHVIQAHAYMRPLQLDEALIVYANKGSQCDWTRSGAGWISGRPKLRAFLVRWDKSLWATMVRRIEDYHRAVSEAQSTLIISDEMVTRYPRICTHDGCDLALECAVSGPCFKLPR